MMGRKKKNRRTMQWDIPREECSHLGISTSQGKDHAEHCRREGTVVRQILRFKTTVFAQNCRFHKELKTPPIN